MEGHPTLALVSRRSGHSIKAEVETEDEGIHVTWKRGTGYQEQWGVRMCSTGMRKCGGETGTDCKNRSEFHL